jgi:hypothetical protein
MVNNTVTEAFGKASVAGALLPCYGPLPGSAENVREEKLVLPRTGATPRRLSVTDDTTLKLFNLVVLVELSSEQVADPSLSSAQLAFRIAANELAQRGDHLVFNGHPPEIKVPIHSLAVISSSHSQDVYGLVSGHLGTGTIHQIEESAERFAAAKADPKTKKSLEPTTGDHVVTEVALAVAELETASHPGPFACVLGTKLFVIAHTPAIGFVLPADRITPLLNGPLLRSGQMPPNAGIVVSLAANAIDLVVATPAKAQFLQVTEDAKYLFRVYEKFVWRIKDKASVRGLGTDLHAK